MRPEKGEDAVGAEDEGMLRTLCQVDQPLCCECAARVREEMDAATAEVEAECAAYEAALQRLQQENAQPLSNQVSALTVRVRSLQWQLTSRCSQSMYSSYAVVCCATHLAHQSCQAPSSPLRHAFPLPCSLLGVHAERACARPTLLLWPLPDIGSLVGQGSASCRVRNACSPASNPFSYAACPIAPCTSPEWNTGHG